jgi:hypothetical protein
MESLVWLSQSSLVCRVQKGLLFSSGLPHVSGAGEGKLHDKYNPDIGKVRSYIGKGHGEYTIENTGWWGRGRAGSRLKRGRDLRSA